MFPTCSLELTQLPKQLARAALRHTCYLYSVLSSIPDNMSSLLSSFSSRRFLSAVACVVGKISDSINNPYGATAAAATVGKVNFEFAYQAATSACNELPVVDASESIMLELPALEDIYEAMTASTTIEVDYTWGLTLDMIDSLGI